MDPLARFCHNPDCPARGQLGLGNVRVHSRKERRYRCTTCGRTFAATHDTPLYRLKKPTELVIIVLTLLCHGCPPQAIVAAFGLDERTGTGNGPAARRIARRRAATVSLWSRPRPNSQPRTRRVNTSMRTAK